MKHKNDYRFIVGKALSKSFVLLNFLLLSAISLSGQTPELIANFTKTAPIIDGHLDDTAWSSAIPVILKENRSGTRVEDPQLTTRVLVCHDEDTLYIAFDCNDPDIWTTFTQRDEHLWEEEAVEVFIDIDTIPENYLEIEVSPANVLFDSYIVDPKNIDVPETSRLNLKGIKTAVQVNGSLNKRDDQDASWQVEIALPYRDMINSLTPEINSDTKIKINFYRLDKNNGKEGAAYSWSPTENSFHKPSVFGKLVLMPKDHD
ncbi:MAG: carbohydrate-binding family 9-like protein [Maribacter sp.]|nr:carbohydrate-binding family 9-like protein [Maribacter sp.]